MATWGEFERQAPDIAAAGRRLFAKHEIAFLGTVSAEGSPRIHPFVPALTEGRLWAFVMDRSPKRRDLDRSGQYAIHAMPGREDEEFFIAGRAEYHADEGLRARVGEVMPYSDIDVHHLLYEFDIDRALWTIWQNFQQPGMKPVHRKWRDAR